MLPATGLAALPKFRDYHSKRISSYDHTGGNYDCWDLQGGETRTITLTEGGGR